MFYTMKNKKGIPLIDKIIIYQILEPCINSNGFLKLANIIKLSFILLVLNVLIDPWFHIEILDYISYGVNSFIFCNYFLIFIPTLINLLLIIFLFQYFFIYIKFYNPLILRKRKIDISFLFILTFLFVITFKNLVPNIMDLPMVLQNKYNVRIITQDYDMDASINNIINKHNGSTKGNVPSSWFRSEFKEVYNRGSKYKNRICYIRINDTDECRLSGLKYSNIANFNQNEYPIKIKYLPHSKIILQITN